MSAGRLTKQGSWVQLQEQLSKRILGSSSETFCSWFGTMRTSTALFTWLRYLRGLAAFNWLPYRLKTLSKKWTNIWYCASLVTQDCNHNNISASESQQVRQQRNKRSNYTTTKRTHDPRSPCYQCHIVSDFFSRASECPLEIFIFR